ncbi:MAG: lipase maturation factor family protein [Verrucomicrobia bacterium]|nr:lipase maturation factor family protein [Verrucomicrobiota bacterium]
MLSIAANSFRCWLADLRAERRQCFLSRWLFLRLLGLICDSLGFQWDILLLETGFLSIFFAPRQWWPRWRRESPPSLVVLWLFRWLLFRLMFMSGAVKLLSEDFTWWNLEALTVHYETQPLPTWLGWHAHQLPVDLHKISCAIMFGIELIIPAFVFGGRLLRQIACGAFVLLMLLISFTIVGHVLIWCSSFSSWICHRRQTSNWPPSGRCGRPQWRAWP